jgi:hypothetical protein
MDADRIQNIIIRKVLNSKDDQLLNYLNQLLSSEEGHEHYILSASEEKIISESIDDYQTGNTISNENVFSRNEKWIEV